MIVCNLDDSGKDQQNPITSLGGYAAPQAVWDQFEAEAEPIFQQYIGNIPLHAVDLYRTEGPYQGWSLIKKQSFVAQLCLKLYPHQPLGVSFSVLKASYATRAHEALKRGLRKRTATPYSFCMTAILNWILADVRLGKEAHVSGLLLRLEDGHEHNKDAKLALDRIRAEHALDTVHPMTFLKKTDCRAIQMADLFAYYVRRHNAKTDPVTRAEPEADPVLKVLLENLRHRTFVATDFGPDIKATRFLGPMGRIVDR